MWSQAHWEKCNFGTADLWARHQRNSKSCFPQSKRHSLNSINKSSTPFKVFYPTIEDTYEANVDTDRGLKEMVRFYDLGGINSKVKEIPRHYFSITDAYILVYSINSQESFLIMDSLKKDIDKNKEKKDAVIIVLGNKLDLVEERQVDYTQASAWAAKEKVRLFEVSVFDHQTLIEPFVHLCSRLNPPPQKSSFAQLSMGRKIKE